MNGTDDISGALAPVVQAFRSLNIRHYVGGSVASSFHGATRSTIDVDVIAEIDDDSVERFLELLSDDYYVSEPAIRDAIRRKACFNLVHFPTSFKVDIFVSRDRPFDRDCMTRAVLGRIGAAGNLEVAVASAEDTIISKLEWYKLGNETSQRQWQDVMLVLQLLGDEADLDYLRSAAKLVGVGELLNRLLSSAE